MVTQFVKSATSTKDYFVDDILDLNFASTKN